MINHLPLTIAKSEPRIDTRLLAQQLHNEHHNTLAQVTKYQMDFELLGKVLFQTEPLPDSRTGQKEKFAVLTEDQAYLLLTYSRNTQRVRGLKVKLVKAFSEARRADIQHGAEYLPSYHQLHDEIHAKACMSANERHVHANINKLVNKAAGIGPGQRNTMTAPTQSLIAVAQSVAAKAMQDAPDHHAGYQIAKARLEKLSAMTQIGGAA